MRFLERDSYICAPCAEDKGWSIPEGHMPTWNYLECDCCGEKKEVTKVRDYRK